MQTYSNGLPVAPWGGGRWRGEGRLPSGKTVKNFNFKTSSLLPQDVRPNCFVCRYLHKCRIRIIYESSRGDQWPPWATVGFKSWDMGQFKDKLYFWFFLQNAWSDFFQTWWESCILVRNAEYSNGTCNPRGGSRGGLPNGRTKHLLLHFHKE